MSLMRLWILRGSSRVLGMGILRIYLIVMQGRTANRLGIESWPGVRMIWSLAVLDWVLGLGTWGVCGGLMWIGRSGKRRRGGWRLVSMMIVIRIEGYVDTDFFFGFGRLYCSSVF